ncbi:DUF3438 family protein [Pasteurella atlantica]|uniref:DUF3438 family protein n=2 Tax=Pasteurellaceae TaxID=712 RepID=A0ACC6HL63_9PAST|nr:DUF3438 family protein [Pasteurella atlantica]MDP8051512.1 DUF3438 family protein [Pasteurella atlantica]MDP8104909.1 DUF3438 family protein [Pasteurella atlantica]MDP8148283.1 DUF3438 family protein [Pasteurella atlantica]
MKSKMILSYFLFIFSIPTFAINMVIGEHALTVPLPVNKEIVIKFPQPVTHTELLNTNNTDKLRQLLRPDGILMLQAGEEFSKTRLIATQIDGNIVILDLEAKNNAVNHHTINLVQKKINLPEKKVKHQPIAKEENPYKPDFLKNKKPITKSQSSPQINFNTMVQYGFSHFLGPRRLIKELPARPIKMSKRNLQHWIRVWGNKVAIKPLKQWKINDDYLTILLINNTSSQPVTFDPRALRGRIKFTATIITTLEPKGNINDQTLYAVITSVPFNKAIQR